MSKLKQAIDALLLANPLCLAMRYDDGLGHCIEASVNGAMALQKHGVSAEAVPCTLRADNQPKDRSLTIGMHPQELYERFDKSDGKCPPYEEWIAHHAHSLPAEEEMGRMHMIIRASHDGEHVFVDLTAGQIRKFGFDVPLHIVSYGTEVAWHGFDFPDGTSIEYGEYHGTPEDASKFHNAGLVDDYDNLMDLGVQCGLEYSKFHMACRAAQPNEYRQAVARLERLVSEGAAA